MLGGPVIKHLAEQRENEVVRIEFSDGRSASVWERFLVVAPNFVSFYNRWDAGMISLKHGHRGDHVVFVLEGEVSVGERLCPKGTHLYLMHGDTFGPWIAGPAGCELLGVIAGEGSAFWADEDMEDYQRLLAQHGARPGAVPTPELNAPWKIHRTVLPGPLSDPD